MDKTTGIGLAIGVALAAAMVGAAWWVTSQPEEVPAVQPKVSEKPAPNPDVEPPERPNVLIVLWDTVRADRMSLYGHDKPTTPRLDAFAEEAVVYENATSPGMWTLPAHSSMFTGLPGTTHGATATYRWLDAQHETLAEILGEEGYDTFAFSANLIASPMANVLQGFDTVHTTFPRKGAQKGRYIKPSKIATRDKRIKRDRSTEISPSFEGNGTEKWGKAVHKDAAPVAHKALTDFLGEHDGSKPFFAYLNMMEAHTPRIPSLSARNRVTTEEQRELGLKTDLSLYAENEYIIGKRSYTEAELEAIAGVYDAALVDLDDATGALFDDLEQRGILDNTVVIVVADHGEALGEHQMFEHRWSVYQELLHVPLLVRYPEKMKPRRVKERVSTIDVFNTVLELTETEARTTAGITSKSLTRADHSQPIFVQMLDPYAAMIAGMRSAYPEVDLKPWMRTYSVVFEGDEKLIVASDGEKMLFDVGADPHEHENLADRPERVAELVKVLQSWETSLKPYNKAGQTASDGGAPATRAETCSLCQLGYMDGSECDGC